ncbi:TRAP transporter substrate-binding protein [Paenibacillus chungangensis]|uniref:TRAP transporter substrate-binding protein n=1 Tax=Paenibacillus chungangensis TaxID=696535 RepID=A0ABW3HQV4_9BACL
MKKWFVGLVATAMVTVLGACGGSDAPSGKTSDGGEKETYEFKVANVLSASDVTAYGLDKFAEIAAEKSDGRIKVEVLHGGQLGSGVETFEAVKNGNIDMASDSFANLASITPAFEIFHLPFLFDSREQALAAFRSEKIKDRVNSELAESNLSWFASFEIGGPREVGTSKKKISKLEDFEGLKLRASRSPLEIAAQEAWGAKGVTVDWPETPEAVRLGMVDGLTVPYASFYSGQFHEGGLIKYLLDLNFQWYSLVTVVNKDKWAELPEDIRQILSESIQEAQEWHVDFLSDYITENIQKMTEAGVEVYALPDEEQSRMKDVTKEKVWSEFVGQKGIPQDKLDLILSEIENVDGSGWGYSIN